MGLRKAQVALPVWPAHRDKTAPARSATEFEITEKVGERDRVAMTERESDRRRREGKWQTHWCCRDQQRMCRMAQASVKKLEHTGPAEKERVALVPQREQLASTLEPPLPKRKGTKLSVQSTRS